MTYQKAHGRARAFEIAKGIVFIIFAIFAFANPNAGIITLAIVFGLDLLIVHLIKLIADIRLTGPQKRLRETNVAFDSLAIAVGIIMIMIPTLIVRVLIIPIIIGLFIFGATRIANGGFSEGLSRGRRILTITIGIISDWFRDRSYCFSSRPLLSFSLHNGHSFLSVRWRKPVLGINKQSSDANRKTQPTTTKKGEPGPGQIMEVPRSSNVLKLLTDAFGRYRKTGEKAKDFASRKRT